jgi:crotonobetainyl-CoA:carnitine CoA-transferase CaiB-like acyl-CoA transferase
MSATDPRPRGSAPSLGEDTKQVLQELMSISLDDYLKLKEDGVL